MSNLGIYVKAIAIWLFRKLNICKNIYRQNSQKQYKAFFMTCFVSFVFVMFIVKQSRHIGSPNSDSCRVVDSVVVQNDMLHHSSYAVCDMSTQNKCNLKDKPHRIYSVSSFKNTFPDNNDVQIISAKQNGVSPVEDRNDAERRMKELVFIGSNPYFYVDKLNSSIPYLVPKASILLQDIGKSFFDSLYVKGIPFHKIIITSVLRTKRDISRLRRSNLNATENSCHLYGTTVDICYNRYKTVEMPEGPHRRVVSNDTLKWVLSEVLRDFRNNGRCYIKYEVKQGCFHLTVK